MTAEKNCMPFSEKRYIIETIYAVKNYDRKCYYCGPTFKSSLTGNAFTLFKYCTDISPKHVLMTKRACWF
jgi:hypothetical protein